LLAGRRHADGGFGVEEMGAVKMVGNWVGHVRDVGVVLGGEKADLGLE
jgi:hypothetical protein